MRVVDLRYRPGRRCVLQYAVAVAGEDGEAILSGPMAPRDGQGVAPRRSASRRARPDATLPALDLSLYRYPSDPELPGASRAMNPAAVSEAMAEAGGRRLALVAAHVLAYRPGLRATVGYDTAEGLALVGKVTRPSRARRLEADALLLGRLPATGLRLLLPTTVLLDWPILLYDRVDGLSLSQKLEEGNADAQAPALASALAAFHATSLPLERQREKNEEADRIAGHVDTLVALCPSQAPRLRRLGERLVAVIRAATTTPAIVHGDLHDENVLLGHDGISLIDLEEASRGDPVVDVARLLGSLRKRAVLEPALGRAADSFAGAFVEAYQGLRPFDQGLAVALEAGFLLKSALHCFETQRPQWADDIDRLVGEAERLAEGCR